MRAMRRFRIVGDMFVDVESRAVSLEEMVDVMESMVKLKMGYEGRLSLQVVGNRWYFKDVLDNGFGSAIKDMLLATCLVNSR